LSASSFGGNPVAVDTSVTITIQFITALENRTEDLVINSGNNSGIITFDSTEGDYIDSAVPLTINLITPSSFGSQNYSSGGVQSLGTCSP
jgi:hypothetical protein